MYSLTLSLFFFQNQVYKFTATEPVQLKATTCSVNTPITTSLTLYDQQPNQLLSSSDASHSLVASETPGFFCSLLYADLHDLGDYWYDDLKSVSFYDRTSKNGKLSCLRYMLSVQSTCVR